MVPRSSSQKTLRSAMLEEGMTSRDASVSNPSFRVYYGVGSVGAVPFLWESAPGTPKNAISDAALPPLTPPPSYYSNSKATKLSKSSSSKKLLPSPAASFVHSILPKLRRSHTMPARPSKDAPPLPPVPRSRVVASPRSSFSSTSRGDDEDGGAASPTSTLCFRARHSRTSVTGGRGSSTARSEVQE